MKKFLTLFIIAVLLNALGFGCRGLSQEERAAVRPVVLNYWTIYNDVDQLKKFATEYQQARPYVKVNIRQVRYDEFDQLFTTALADDVAPDIVSMHTSWLPKNAGRLSPMPGSVDMARVILKGKYDDQYEVVVENIPMPSKKSIKDGYVQTVYGDVTVGDEVYGLPLAFDALAIYYNRDILDRAGIPEPPTNWDEFVEAVQKTTKFNRNGDIVQSGTALGTGENIGAYFDIISLFMMQSGVTMASGNTVTFASGIEKVGRDHPVFKALDFYTDFARQTKEVYSWNEKKGNALDEFVRGNVAFYFSYAYDYPRIRAQAPQMNLEIMPVFQLTPDNPKNVANYWVESVVKKSKYQNEAWDFVRFIASPQKVKEYVDATFRPSPIRSHIVEQQLDENIEPFATQALYAETWYKGSNIDIAKDAFSNLISGYLQPFDGRDEDFLKRDKQLIINTAARVQQTM